MPTGRLANRVNFTVLALLPVYTGVHAHLLSGPVTHTGIPHTGFAAIITLTVLAAVRITLVTLLFLLASVQALGEIQAKPAYPSSCDPQLACCAKNQGCDLAAADGMNDLHAIAGFELIVLKLAAYHKLLIYFNRQTLLVQA